MEPSTQTPPQSEVPVPQLVSHSPFNTPPTSPFSTPQKPVSVSRIEFAQAVTPIDFSSAEDEPASGDQNAPPAPPLSPRSLFLTNSDNFYDFVDDKLIQSLESNAQQSALNLTALVGHLRAQLQHLSSLSVQYMKLHKMSVENASEEVQESMLALEALIAKSQALNTELRQVHQLHDQIKQTKKLLEALDTLASQKVLEPIRKR